jgi:hypothetical protein
VAPEFAPDSASTKVEISNLSRITFEHTPETVLAQYAPKCAPVRPDRRSEELIRSHLVLS